MTRTSKCTESALDVKTHFRPSETFQYTEFTTCHPPGIKRGFIKREAPLLLGTNSFRINLKRKLRNLKLTFLIEATEKS